MKKHIYKIYLIIGAITGLLTLISVLFYSRSTTFALLMITIVLLIAGYQSIERNI